MTPELRKVLLFFGTTIAVGVIAVILAPRLVGMAAGPEPDIVGQLARTEKEGLSLAVPGSPSALVSQHHHFDRVVVQVDLSDRTADASSTLDFTGKLGEIQVSSLGVEKTRFVYAGSWRPAQGWAPRLSAVVTALDARRRAIDRGDVPALAALAHQDAGALSDPEWTRLWVLGDRRYDVRAWFIRLERDSVQVTEEYRLVGVLPDRPVDEEGRKSLSLERQAGEFFFSKGLM